MPNLLREISGNPGAGILRAPLQIVASLLAEVGVRAAELDDPRLNELMCRLTIYELADPESEYYDKARLQELLQDNEDK